MQEIISTLSLANFEPAFPVRAKLTKPTLSLANFELFLMF